MEVMQGKGENAYRLILLKESHLKTLHHWHISEERWEYYTCRPILKRKPFEEFAEGILKAIQEKKEIIYVLVKAEDPDQPLGKLTLFDYNERNRSAEFGYYLPFENRERGLGSRMLSLFLQAAFSDETLKLNKLYATTSSGNTLSVKLLERQKFRLDGRLREHYWIGENRFDQLVYSILKTEWANPRDGGQL